MPSFRLLKVTSRYAVLSWDFNIKSDCFAQAILYSGSVTQVDSGEISPISHLNITDCFIFPSYEASFNLTELHPYRSYHNLTLSSCDSRDCYLEYDYHNITFSTDAAGKSIINYAVPLLTNAKFNCFSLAGAEKLAISQTKLFLSHNAIMATIEFSYSDCFGPTKFELSLSLLTSFDSIELDYTFPSVNKTVSNLNYPQCPDSNEEITVELLHWRPYRFYHLTVTPSTNVSSAEPTVITVGTESAGKRNISLY